MHPWPEKLHKWCCVPMVSHLEVHDVQLPLVGDTWSPVWSKRLIFFFFYPLELTDLWRDILGLCKCPTVHQHFTLGLTCTGDWFLPEPIFSVVVIKMVVFQLRSPSPFTLLHLHWYGVMGSWFSPWFIIYYWPVLSPILYLYILSSTVRALVPSTIKNI